MDIRVNIDLFLCLVILIIEASQHSAHEVSIDNRSSNKESDENISKIGCLDFTSGKVPRVSNLSLDMDIGSKNKYLNVPLTPKFYGQLSKITGIFLYSSIRLELDFLLKEVINIGANVNYCDSYGITPLYLALERECDKAVRILMECGADVNYSCTVWLTENSTQVSPKIERTILRTAAIRGDVRVLGGLIKLGADVNRFDKDGLNPLYSSVLTNTTVSTIVLLANNASVNARSPTGRNLLQTAVAENSYRVVRELIGLGADCTAEDDEGLTPLLIAIQNNDLKMIYTLLEEKVPINQTQTSTGNYPIHHAIWTNSYSTFLTLLDDSDSSWTNKRGLTPFAYSVYLNRTEMINIFKLMKGLNLTYYIRKGIDSYTPLHLAVMENDSKALLNLIKYGANVNKADTNMKTPLWLAVESNNSAIVDLLLSNGANITPRKNESLLNLAVLKRCVKCIKSLLKAGAKIDTRTLGKTPLGVAVFKEYVDIVRLLYENGANINAKQDEYGSPLVLAAAEGKLSSLKELVRLDRKKAEYSVNIVSRSAIVNNRVDVIKYVLEEFQVFANRSKVGLFHLAVRSGSVDVLNYLFSLGVPLDETVGGMTALWNALRNRRPEVMGFLIVHGADMTVEGKASFQTPAGRIERPWSLLHEAAFLDAVEEASILLEYGFDPNIRDTVSWTPLHVAEFSGSSGVAGLLMRNGADVNAKTAAGFTPMDL